MDERVEQVEEGEDKYFSHQVTAIVIGAGRRGNVYAQYALNFPKRFKIVAVADIIERRRSWFKKKYNLEDEFVFSDWKDVAEKKKFADAVIIATLEHLHKDPAVAFSKLGYQILLEKPMAPTLEDCEEIVKTCKENNTILFVGHVLRYSPRFSKALELIKGAKIGDIVHIDHMEPIGLYHFAHSFVRGNWRNQQESGFSLLTKSCHDIDLIHALMKGFRCLKISSFGSLSHFKQENKPKGAGSRCIDCKVEKSCPYSALRLYLEPVNQGCTDLSYDVVCDTCSLEEIEDSIRTGPYGRCVFQCDNDVVSNQVVNMEYEGGRTVSFSMVAFTEKRGVRRLKIYGTKGEMECNDDQQISVYDFDTRRRTTYQVNTQPEFTSLVRHDYADYYLTHAFVKAVSTGDKSQCLSGPDDAMDSHRLVFFAEKSRLEGRVIHLTQ